MTPLERERWKKTRERGLVRFLLLHGFLGWGFTGAAIWMVIITLFHQKLGENAASDGVLHRALIALTVFPAVGLLWAARKWSSMEERYKK